LELLQSKRKLTMNSCRALLVLLTASFFISLSSGCGSSRDLLAVSISPAAADAQNFPNGMVQFTATGTFSRDPTTATLGPNDVTWCVGTSTGTCGLIGLTGGVVDSNGMAHCANGFSGTVNVLAGVPSTEPHTANTGAVLKIFGAATLTCP